MSSTSIDQPKIGCSQRWDEFKTFLYNPSNKTVLGRTGVSWAKILFFYMIYYGFLACLFALSITIVLNSLDEYTPRYQTRVQTPGVAIQPKIPSNVEQTSDIKFKLGDANTYQRYLDQMDKFLKPYQDQSDNNLFHNCDLKGMPLTGQKYSADQTAKACRFDLASLGSCVASPYGYPEGNPCILVKINRIIDWFPVGYTNISTATGNGDSNAPPLSTFLKAYNIPYRPYLIYTACYGSTSEDEEKLNQGDRTNTRYYPEQNGLPFVYFPYKGKKRQPSYLNPVVAVQFTNVTKDVDIDVKCKAYALNIRDSKQMAEGYFDFVLKVES